MATGNFYQRGNHGLNMIECQEEWDLTDSLDNVTNELVNKGYNVIDIARTLDTPRSFDTGIAYEITNGNKVVAILEVCTGYYENANINIFTGDELFDFCDRNDVTLNKREVARVVKIVKMFTTELRTVARFSNGEVMYELTDNKGVE